MRKADKLNSDDWQTLLTLVRERAEFCEEQEDDKAYAKEAKEMRELARKIVAQ